MVATLVRDKITVLKNKGVALRPTMPFPSQETGFKAVPTLTRLTAYW